VFSKNDFGLYVMCLGVLVCVSDRFAHDVIDVISHGRSELSRSPFNHDVVFGPGLSRQLDENLRAQRRVRSTLFDPLREPFRTFYGTRG
jgi:hypothetical protein